MLSVLCASADATVLSCCRYIRAHGWSYKLEVAHRIQQKSLFKKLFFAMKNRQLQSFRELKKQTANTDQLDVAESEWASSSLSLRQLQFRGNREINSLDTRVSRLGRAHNELRAKLLHLKEAISGLS